jgi:uncharacterized protein YlxP (DUF503 family)
MAVGLLTLHIKIPMCSSLKEKRSQLKPLLNRLGKEFNISVAELDYQDQWDETIIGCTYLSNNGAHTQRVLQKVLTWIERNFPHLYIIQDRIELI